MIGPAYTVESVNISEWRISAAGNSDASATQKSSNFTTPFGLILTCCSLVSDRDELSLFMGGFERLGNLPGDGFAYHDWVNPLDALYHDPCYE